MARNPSQLAASLSRDPADPATRAAVAQAITLVESTRPDHRAMSRQLLAQLTPPAEKTWRVGISGVPGVGKSTFVESLGSKLIDLGHRVGVLAVDPSSIRTGGSVLGDKTRMTTLAADDRAYIRPSPTSGTLGGVARATSQAVAVLESAGYDVILIETVGVGQSEITVAKLVDSFLLLALARSGDQLQGIKKGVLEIADVVAVNKADGDYALAARSAARELAGALRLVYGGGATWTPPALTCSGLTGEGIDEVWNALAEHRASLGDRGLAAKRAAQQWAFAESLVQEEVLDRVRRSAGVRSVSVELQDQVLAGEVSAVAAADRLLAAFDQE